MVDCKLEDPSVTFYSDSGIVVGLTPLRFGPSSGLQLCTAGLVAPAGSARLWTASGSPFVGDLGTPTDTWIEKVTALGSSKRITLRYSCTMSRCQKRVFISEFRGINVYYAPCTTRDRSSVLGSMSRSRG
ncbi:uncharacterized protein LOC112463400 [Temnothorax curvispinosus]|uniref:Uncharacterized protein LOC112463400 n=1 Tax=Temnothorax curvispinosus TaxID=300111 RepID=A0A6J1QSW4_9HYME|nr:uncharacterized protein LOC112463400 [Temnothorax curvispinosus]